MGMVAGSDLNAKQNINTMNKVKRECAKLGLVALRINSQKDIKIISL